MRNANPSLPVSTLVASIAMALAPLGASAASGTAQPAAAPSSNAVRAFVIAAPKALPAQGVVPLAAAAPSASASPSNVDFGQVIVGTSSPPADITISYTAGFTFVGFDTNGGPPCYGSGIYGGPFSYTTTCTPGTAASAGSCNFHAQYTPFYYFQTDSLTVYACDSALNPATSFTLTGEGVPQPPVSAGPNPYDFGDVQVGLPSAPARFGFFNPGPFSVDINPPFTFGGDFFMTETDCGTTLGPGSSCTATVMFQPSVPGGQSGELVLPAGFGPAAAGTDDPKILEIICDCSAPVATISLTGNGVLQAQMQVSPDTVAFPPYTLGNPPESEAVTITNAGNSLMTFTNMSVTSPFTLTNSCPANLGPNESCKVTVGFSTTTAGSVSGTLSITSDGGSSSIPVTALAQLVPVPILTVTPLSIGFGDRMIGSSSAAQRVTVTNTGGAPATLNPLAVSLDFAIQNTSCGASLAPGASCFADLAFHPIGFGPRSGSLSVNGNDAGSPHTVNLSGAGCRPFIFGRGASCAP